MRSRGALNIMGTPAITEAVIDPPSIEVLAEAQGVRPVKDSSELAGLWPKDDDPDAFDAFVREMRSERRQVAQTKPNSP